MPYFCIFVNMCENKPGIEAYIFNPSIREAEADSSVSSRLAWPTYRVAIQGYIEILLHPPQK